jgi:hypothetical protein
MKTTRVSNLSAAALVGGLALTNIRAVDLSPAETKAIAEEGFIYGLPIVANYAVMYDFAVDKNSGQFNAPLNQIKSHKVLLKAVRDESNDTDVCFLSSQHNTPLRARQRPDALRCNAPTGK